jgi:sigma-B regulation protein RsbU (phosphoserine phosphatase)
MNERPPTEDLTVVLTFNASPPSTVPADRRRVLLADDDDDTRRLLGQYLSRWGFTVLQARNGTQAAEILGADDAPAIALIDWMMPGMEGIEVCKLLRQQQGRPYTYLIFLTGKSNKDEIAAGLEAGADDYVTKPCDMNELRARLRVAERIATLERDHARQVVTLLEAADQVRKLKELVPICAWCKRVRDDADYWHSIEEYLYLHTGSDFTHGICPSCLEGLRADLPGRRPY